MAIQGKRSISIRKQRLSSERAMAVGAVKILPFAHESVAGGESEIDLSSLVLPSGITTPNPSTIDFERAKLLFNKDALILISDSKGRLIREVDYNITSNLKITFTDTFGTTVPTERFFGYINPVVSSETLVADVNPVVESGELGAGLTEINLGKSFKVNANSATQIGEVAVYIDGQLFLRNVGNATAAPAADGNYEEVDSGDGTSVQIKLNNSDPAPRGYVVISTALSTVRPDASIMTEVERQAGVIDALVEHVALLAGIPESNLGQATPTQPQLKTFSERVVALEGEVDALEVEVDELQSYREVSSAETLSAKRTDLILADTSGGIFTIDLPASPVAGDRISIVDHSGNWGTNTLTVGRNGHNIQGAAADLTLSVDNAWVELIYVDPTFGWQVRI